MNRREMIEGTLAGLLASGTPASTKKYYLQAFCHFIHPQHGTSYFWLYDFHQISNRYIDESNLVLEFSFGLPEGRRFRIALKDGQRMAEGFIHFLQEHVLELLSAQLVLDDPFHFEMLNGAVVAVLN